MRYQAALKMYELGQRHWGTENAHNSMLSGRKQKPRLWIVYYINTQIHRKKNAANGKNTQQEKR